MYIFNAQTPYIKVHVDKSYLTDGKLTGYTEAYLLSVKSQNSRPLQFTVHLETGALWSGLPISAIRCLKFCGETGLNTKLNFNGSAIPLALLQPYSCLEGSIQAFEYSGLKNYEAEFKVTEDIRLTGFYLFTIDYLGSGLSEDPEQFKTHNIIAESQTGTLFALPNNYCKFVDNHFTIESEEVKLYRRTSNYYLAGS